MKYLLVLILLFPSFLNAHPVSFQDSLGVMGQHSPTLTHNQINYSFRYWFAAGIHHYNLPSLDDNRHATVLSTNFLLKRWNGDALQANLYGVLGIGKSELSGSPEDIGMGLVQFDIEDRQYYFLAKHMELSNRDRSEVRQSTVRVGIAPYQDDFDGLHSWLILEGQRTQLLEGNNDYDLTPLLRLFYRNVLFEIGQSFKGETQFNYISHF